MFLIHVADAFRLVVYILSGVSSIDSSDSDSLVIV